MMKTYISSLLVVCLAGAQTIRAQENLDDVFAQLDAAQGDTAPAAAPAATPTAITQDAPAPAQVQSTQPAAVQAASPAPAAVADAPDLFSRGVAYYRAGDFHKAEVVFEAILAEDEYNRPAMEYLRRTTKKFSSREVEMQSTTRAQAFSEVDSAWNPEPKEYSVVVDDSNKPALNPLMVKV